jgi:hypothetical protein
MNNKITGITNKINRVLYKRKKELNSFFPMSTINSNSNSNINLYLFNSTNIKQNNIINQRIKDNKSICYINKYIKSNNFKYYNFILKE